MFYKYELACRAAGLSEEDTAELRRFFDAEYKRLKRRKKLMKEKGIEEYSLSVSKEGCQDYCFDLPDPNADTEAEAIHRMELTSLRTALSELPEDDREFLLAVFEDYQDAEKRIGEKLGLSRGQVQYRKKKLIADLRRRMDIS